MDATGHTQRRLIIHCGVQKTATTAFHHFMQRNRDALSARLDILTPERKSLTRALGRSAAQFSLDPGDETEQAFVSNICAVREHLLQSDGQDPVILSHENLPGAMLGRGGETELYPVLPRILRRLEKHLAPFRPHYVFYTREMDAWKRSVYNQAVKSDACAWTLQEFLEETKHCGTWQELESTVSYEIGADRVRFFRLQDEVEEHRPGTQLLRFAGLDDAEIAALEPLQRRPNQSLNAGALEFMRLLNASDLPRNARKPVVDLVVRNQPLFSPQFDQQREGA